MTFVLTIDLGNDAMRSGYDVQVALRKIGERVGAFRGVLDLVLGDRGSIRDENGNAIGRWEVAQPGE